MLSHVLMYSRRYVSWRYQWDFENPKVLKRFMWTRYLISRPWEICCTFSMSILAHWNLMNLSISTFYHQNCLQKANKWHHIVHLHILHTVYAMNQLKGGRVFQVEPRLCLIICWRRWSVKKKKMEGKCSSWNVTGREGEDLGTAVKQKDLCSPAQTVPVWLLSGESDTLIQCLSRPSDALLSFQRNKKMEAWAYTSSSTR